MIQSGILRFSFFVLIAIIVILIGIIFIYYEDKINPFPEVSWIEDQPGATERYVVFTPVLKSNHEVVILGPTVGADYATLRFKDIDNDGVKEAIIET